MQSPTPLEPTRVEGGQVGQVALARTPGSHRAENAEPRLRKIGHSLRTAPEPTCPWNPHLGEHMATHTAGLARQLVLGGRVCMSAPYTQDRGVTAPRLIMVHGSLITVACNPSL